MIESLQRYIEVKIGLPGYRDRDIFLEKLLLVPLQILLPLINKILWFLIKYLYPHPKIFEQQAVRHMKFSF